VTKAFLPLPPPKGDTNTVPTPCPFDGGDKTALIITFSHRRRNNFSLSKGRGFGVRASGK